MTRFRFKLLDQYWAVCSPFSGSFSPGTFVLLSGLLPLTTAPPHRFMNVQTKQNCLLPLSLSEFRFLPNRHCHKVITANSLLGEMFSAYLVCSMYECVILGRQVDPCPEQVPVCRIEGLNMQNTRKEMERLKGQERRHVRHRAREMGDCGRSMFVLN